MNNSQARNLVSIISHHIQGDGSFVNLCSAIVSFLDSFLCREWSETATKRGSWGFYGARMVRWLNCMPSKRVPTPHSIFIKGNSKLPFYSFSTLPFATCPGMGACRDYCYSVKAWRYPAALFRQIQNTVLVRSVVGRAVIRDAWNALPEGATVRLYVDGDFDSAETLAFWMALCDIRPDLRVYGYSKSWDLFIDRDKWGPRWPENYTLNISNGSRYDGDVARLDRMQGLAVTRGEFIALDDAPTAAKGSPRTFVCPGKCGECITPTSSDPITHACGSRRFQGIDILISTH